MRISKELAELIAVKLSEKTFKKWQSLEAKLKTVVQKHYLKQIPEAIKKASEKHPEWFDWGSYIRMDGHGFNRDAVTIEMKVVKNSYGSENKLELTPEIAAEIKDVQNLAKKAKGEYDSLRQEIYNALLALASYKRIAEQFPDAAKYLPNIGPKSLALIPNLDGLKQKIKTQ